LLSRQDKLQELEAASRGDDFRFKKSKVFDVRGIENGWLSVLHGECFL